MKKGRNRTLYYRLNYELRGDAPAPDAPPDAPDDAPGAPDDGLGAPDNLGSGLDSGPYFLVV